MTATTKTRAQQITRSCPACGGDATFTHRYGDRAWVEHHCPTFGRGPVWVLNGPVPVTR